MNRIFVSFCVVGLAGALVSGSAWAQSPEFVSDPWEVRLSLRVRWSCRIHAARVSRVSTLDDLWPSRSGVDGVGPRGPEHGPLDRGVPACPSRNHRQRRRPSRLGNGLWLNLGSTATTLETCTWRAAPSMSGCLPRKCSRASQSCGPSFRPNSTATPWCSCPATGGPDLHPLRLA